MRRRAYLVKKRAQKRRNQKMGFICVVVLAVMLINCISSLAADSPKAPTFELEARINELKVENENNVKPVVGVTTLVYRTENTMVNDTISTVATEPVEITEPTETIETVEITQPTEETVPVETTPVEIVPMISAYGPGELYFYQLSWEEKVLIAKVVWAEARGECYEGKVAVAAVILNRYTSNDPVFNTKSIESVVTQSGAFASIYGVTMWDLDMVPECMEAVEDACKGWDPTRVTFEDGAKYFYAPASISSYQMSLREGVLTLKIGNHNFHNDFNN